MILLNDKPQNLFPSTPCFNYTDRGPELQIIFNNLKFKIVRVAVDFYS